MLRKPSPFGWIKDLLVPPVPAPAAARQPCWPPEEQRARDLIAAVDAGGVPLNPMRVNQIARQLGLEVSTKAPVGETIERIRVALTHTPVR